MDKWANPHILLFLKRRLPKKTVINNLGEKCANAIKCFADQLRNKRAGDHLRYSKTLASIFSKQEICGWPTWA